MNHKAMPVVLWIFACLVIGIIGFLLGGRERTTVIPTKTVVALEAREFLAKPEMIKNVSGETDGPQKELTTNGTVAVFHADLNVVRDQLKNKLVEEQKQQ